MNPSTLGLALLGFQGLGTVLLALVYLGLWQNERRPCFGTWAAAWAAYAVRLGCISAYLVTRAIPWLFAHQLATGASALLLFAAALQFDQGSLSPNQRTGIAVAAAAWMLVSVVGVRNFAVGGLAAALALAAVTLLTGYVFWRHRRLTRSHSATVLAARMGFPVRANGTAKRGRLPSMCSDRASVRLAG